MTLTSLIWSYPSQVRTSPGSGWKNALVAECLLNQATVKDSYERYAEEAAALGRVID